jgi:ketosteroid isomerase-like protein
MSSEQNVAIVRRVYEAYERRDVATIQRLVRPDLVWQPQEVVLEAATLKGVDEVLAWLADWDDQFTDSRIEPEEFIDLGDRVVVVSRVSGRGRMSDVEVDMHTAHVFSFRDGKIAGVRAFFDRDEALEAAEIGSAPLSESSSVDGHLMP